MVFAAIGAAITLMCAVGKKVTAENKKATLMPTVTVTQTDKALFKCRPFGRTNSPVFDGMEYPVGQQDYANIGNECPCAPRAHGL